MNFALILLILSWLTLAIGFLVGVISENKKSNTKNNEKSIKKSEIIIGFLPVVLIFICLMVLIPYGDNSNNSGSQLESVAALESFAFGRFFFKFFVCAILSGGILASSLIPCGIAKAIKNSKSLAHALKNHKGGQCPKCKAELQEKFDNEANHIYNLLNTQLTFQQRSNGVMPNYNEMARQKLVAQGFKCSCGEEIK
ncbi:MAG: hypothetical protein FWH17_10635 [Oscillospiraceae bacterium]|nr:hypothetical protein [Oscillospiraceae bacterium]